MFVLIVSVMATCYGERGGGSYFFHFHRFCMFLLCCKVARVQAR